VGLAPRFLARTNKNVVPITALLLSSLFGCLGFLNVTTSSATVFNYFVNLVTVFGILTWISLLVIHIFFVRARRAQGVSNTDLVYTAPLGLYGTYFALFVCIIIAIFKNFSVFVKSSAVGGTYGNFDSKNFIVGYLGIPIYLSMFVGYKIMHKTKFRKAMTTDLYAGMDEVNNEENEFLEKQKVKNEEREAKSGIWYRLIAWMF
jgi:amino acid transporter